MPQSTILPQFSGNEFLKRAVDVALYYGFTSSRRVAKEAERINKSTSPHIIKRPSSPKSAFNQHVGELHSALQIYLENNFQILPQPVLFYHSNIEHKSKSAKSNDSLLLGLQVIGTNKSIAEAIIIKTATDILKEVGVKNTTVYINTIGDRDSIAKYNKELSAYLRKNINDMPVHARSLLRKDVLQCLSYLYYKKDTLCEQAPRSVEFLSESSRKHLREVLEHMETVNISYEMDTGIVGQGNCHTQTVFEIRDMSDTDDDSDVTVYARGCRYDEFARKLFRLNIPAVGVIIESRIKGKGSRAALNPKRIRKPKVYFIQFGFEARLQSLAVIEMLRKSRIPVQQSIGNDTLTRQLEIAEEVGIPFIIIMGQKEALDRMVIVRNLKTRSQNTVALDILPEYLKRISKHN